MLEAICRSKSHPEGVEKHPDIVTAAIDRIGDGGALLGALEADDHLRKLAAARFHDVWYNGFTAVRLAQTLPELAEAIACGSSDSDIIAGLCCFERQMNDSALSRLVRHEFEDASMMRRKALAFAAADPDAAAESQQWHHLGGLPAFIEYLTPKAVANRLRRRV